MSEGKIWADLSHAERIERRMMRCSQDIERARRNLWHGAKDAKERWHWKTVEKDRTHELRLLNEGNLCVVYNGAVLTYQPEPPPFPAHK